MRRNALSPMRWAAILLVLAMAACQPLIGPYSPRAYENATSLKAETLALMNRATEPYAEHQAKVQQLYVELEKAHEYVRGVPSDSISARQWQILIARDGDLIGTFMTRWRERETLSRVYIREFKGIVADAFDEIICLEANKKEQTECVGTPGAN